MTKELTKRKLTAILSADVKGYSRLMQDDEEATVGTITVYREVMTGLIEGQNGRVVDAKGDNLLAEFPSVVDAVRCAVKIQKELKVKNDELPENRKMEFRIGINLGDVIEEEETIYGDGVNIAARLEGLAEGGGICISRTAFDQVKNKLDLGYEYLGEHSVKNIAEPVRVYRVLMEPKFAGKVIGEERPKPKQWRFAALVSAVALIVVTGAFSVWHFYFRPPSIEPASVEKMAYPLPDKPSIAVLPFVNMSDNPKQEIFCDGITEEIITGLSKVTELFVISRNSSFTYKGKHVKVQQVAQDLGVRYVLEGSVRKSQENLRITAQLIDAIKGHHLWADRWDRELKDVFAIQDEITMKITTAMQVKLTTGEQARMVAKGTNNLDAYLRVLEANVNVAQFNQESNTLARQLAKEAIKLDPEYAYAYTILGKTYMLEVWLGTTRSPKQSIAKAIKLAQKSIAIDESLGRARGLLGFLYTMTGQNQKGIVEAESAITLEPNSDLAHQYLGLALRFGGRPNEAIPVIKKAIRLNPSAPGTYLFNLGLSYLFSGQYEEAIGECKKATTREPDNLGAQIALTVAYGLSGRDEEARATASEVLRINSKFSLEHFTKTLAYKNQADRDRYIGALSKAGLPDKAPLPLPDKPSIAVLPFVNMSEDPKQEYFSDGITEEIITALSKTPRLFVIARNSSFTYKGKLVKVQQVSEELGVQYVVEGSVRRAEDRVRITAQLIDTLTGRHIWAEKYDREIKDIFDIQDEITKKIITALQVKLTEGEDALVLGSGTNNLDAYLKTLKATEYLMRFNKESMAMAQRLSEEAIALDPQYTSAYRVLGVTHMHDVFLGGSKSPKASMAKAMELLQKAIVLDDAYAEAHGALGFMLALMKQYDKAVSEGELAVTLNPNSADSLAWLGMTYRYVGRWEDAIQVYKKAIRLNPIPPNWYLFGIGLAYAMTGQYEEGIRECRKAIRLAPNSQYPHMFMTIIYSLAGREAEAQTQAKELLKINPKFSIERWMKMLKYKKQVDREQVTNALRKAGLK